MSITFVMNRDAPSDCLKNRNALFTGTANSCSLKKKAGEHKLLSLFRLL